MGEVRIAMTSEDSALWARAFFISFRSFYRSNFVARSLRSLQQINKKEHGRELVDAVVNQSDFFQYCVSFDIQHIWNRT